MQLELPAHEALVGGVTHAEVDAVVAARELACGLFARFPLQLGDIPEREHLEPRLGFVGAFGGECRDGASLIVGHRPGAHRSRQCRTFAQRLSLADQRLRSDR